MGKSFCVHGVLIANTPTFHVFGELTAVGMDLQGKKLKIRKSYLVGLPVVKTSYAISVPMGTVISADNQKVEPTLIVAYGAPTGILWQIAFP